MGAGEVRADREETRVLLRPVEPGDLDAIFAQQADEVASRMAGMPVRDRAAFDAHWARVLSDPAVLVRSVVEKGEVVGHAVTFELEGKRHAGYWIARERWGRGLATRALRELLELDPTRPLFAVVSEANAGSIRVLEKCGFELLDPRVEADARRYVLRD